MRSWLPASATKSVMKEKGCTRATDACLCLLMHKILISRHVQTQTTSLSLDQFYDLKIKFDSKDRAELLPACQGNLLEVALPTGFPKHVWIVWLS